MNEKVIHIYWINMIKRNKGACYESESGNNYTMKYIKQAGITDQKLANELDDNIDWCWGNTIDRLEKLGWKVLVGGEVYDYVKKKNVVFKK